MAKKKKPPRKKAVRKKRPPKDPCPAHPEWSTSRYRTFIRSAMRKAWTRWPPRFEALKRVRRPSKSDNPRLKWEFQCAHCRGWFQQKLVSVDHIQSWGSLTGLSHDQAWERLLVPLDQLQVLCATCHDKKTASE